MNGSHIGRLRNIPQANCEGYGEQECYNIDMDIYVFLNVFFYVFFLVSMCGITQLF